MFLLTWRKKVLNSYRTSLWRGRLIMKKIYILLALIILLYNVGSAQMADEVDIKNITTNYTGIVPASKPFSLIDLSKVQWSHSYSLSYFSGGGSSGSMGLYYGNIFYEFSSSLSLDVGIGISHNPGALFNNSVGNDANFYPSINLDYHPSDNFRLSIGIARMPYNYYNPYYGYDGYWRYLNR